MKPNRDEIEQFLIDEGFSYKELIERGEFLICSPFLIDTKYRLGINYKKDPVVYNDFKAAGNGIENASGDWLTFVKVIKNLKNRNEAKKYWFQNYITISKENLQKELNKKIYENKENVNSISTIEIPKDYEQFNIKLKKHKKYFDYLIERNISENIIKNIKLFINDKESRIVFPVYVNNILETYTERSILKNNKLPWKIAKGENKKKSIYNIDNIVSGSTVYLFEGIIDALRTYPRGCALLGRVLTEQQKKLLLSKKPYNIVIILDGDKYGIASQKKIAKELLEDGVKNIYVFNWFAIHGKSKAKDFGEFGIKEQYILDNIDDYSIEWNRTNDLYFTSLYKKTFSINLYDKKT